MTDDALTTDASLARRIFGLLTQAQGGDREVAHLRRVGQVEEARSCIRYGDFPHGAGLLDEVVAGTPESPDAAEQDLIAVAHSVFGQGLESAGDEDGAEKHFRTALDLFSEAHPDFAGDDTFSAGVGSRVVCDIAMALSGTGEHVRAERLIRESRSQGPVTPEATRRLATYAARAGELDHAALLVEEALTVLPTDPECWYTLATVRRASSGGGGEAAPGGGLLHGDGREGAAAEGLVAAYECAARGCLDRGAHEQALDALNALRTLRPDRSDVAVALTESLRRLGRLEEALDEADRGVDLAPESVEARMARALVLMDLERLGEAADEAAFAAERDSAYAAPRAALALCAMQVDDLANAEKWSRESLDLEPGNRPALVTLAWVLATMSPERAAEADELLDDALARWPDDGRLLFLRCKVAVDRDDAGTVVSTLESLMQAEGLDAERAALLVRAYLVLDRVDDALVLLGELVPFWPEDEQIRTLYARARVRAALASDDDAALGTALEEAAAVAQDSPDVAYGRATLLIREGTAESLAAARRELETSLAEHAEHVDSLLLLVSVLRGLEQPQEALRWVDRAAEAGLGRIEHAVLTAECLRDLDRSDDAIATLTGLPAEEDDAGRALLDLRAELLGGAGRWAEAVHDRRTLVERDPTSARRYFDLADAYRLAGATEQAWEAIGRSLELDPDDLSARATWAALLSDQGNVTEARKVIDAILREDPDYSFALRLAIQLAASEEEVTAHADRLARLTGARDADTERAYASLRLGRPARALELIEGHLRERPDDLALLLCAAYASSALSRHDDATRFARRALQLDPDSARTLRALGDVELAAGNVSESLTTLAEAHLVASDDVDVAARYADALASNDEPLTALHVLDDTTARHPSSAFAWRSLAGTLVTLGYYEEAVSCLDRARQLGDADAWTWSALGWCRLHLDPVEAQEALAAFEQAARLTEPDPWLIKDIANAKHALEPGSGDEGYERLIDQVARMGGSDPLLNSLCGWAHFRLRRLARAGRLLLGASTLPRSAVFSRFDLGLVGLCAGRHDQAQRHYESALEILREQDPLRWSGPLRVALVDLEAACVDWPEIADTKETHAVRDHLTQQLAAAPGLPPLRALVR
jgi:tetratricopeptide (TPR) repeat protein